jgi:enterochelin esterase-like enzyme
MQTGQIEWLLAPNRRFAAVLADKGYCHIYEELPSGHNLYMKQFILNTEVVPFVQEVVL